MTRITCMIARPAETAGVRHRARLGALVAVLLAAAFSAGCGAQAETPQAATSQTTAVQTYPVTITDDASRSVTVAAEPQRVVSLAPANTETLFALGVGDKVVGVTSYDDYPAEVADIAKVGDFAGPNMEAVAAADPDVVFVTTGVQGDVVTKLEELGAVVIAIDPLTLDGLYSDIEDIAAITNSVDEGAALVASMRADVEAVRDRIAGEPPVSAFLEIGQNPLYTAGAGTLMDELITLAGGANVVKTAGYVPYSTEELIKADPAVYLVTKGVASDPSAIEKRAGYRGLSSVKKGRIAILEDNLVSRPGPRIVEGLALIADALHPEGDAQ